jgi:hypothetical protein
MLAKHLPSQPTATYNTLPCRYLCEAQARTACTGVYGPSGPGVSPPLFKTIQVHPMRSLNSHNRAYALIHYHHIVLEVLLHYFITIHFTFCFNPMRIKNGATGRLMIMCRSSSKRPDFLCQAATSLHQPSRQPSAQDVALPAVNRSVSQPGCRHRTRCAIGQPAYKIKCSTNSDQPACNADCAISQRIHWGGEHQLPYHRVPRPCLSTP